MKILIAILYCFIFCVLPWCEDNEDDCYKSAINYQSPDDPASFECRIYTNIIDTEDGINCDKAYGVEFEKYHCGGGASSLMGFGYYGCTETDGITYLNKTGIGYFSVTISNINDYVQFYLKNDTNTLYEFQIWGDKITTLTNYGRKAKGILVTIKIPNHEYTVGATSLTP